MHASPSSLVTHSSPVPSLLYSFNLFVFADPFIRPPSFSSSILQFDAQNIPQIPLLPMTDVIRHFDTIAISSFPSS